MTAVTQAVSSPVTRSTVSPTSFSADKLAGTGLSVARMVVGFLFACHGAQNLFGWFGGTHMATFGTWPGWYASVIELVAGGLVAIGLFTRPAAVLCSGTMAYAYFSVHQAAGLLPIENKGEPAALYAWIFLLIALIGPGSLAVDAIRRRRRG